VSVLILAEKIDATADRVVSELTGRGVPLLRVDTADFPDRIAIEAQLRGDRWCGVLRTRKRHAVLEELRSVWYRATPRFGWPPEMSSEEREHAEREARFGLGGVLGDLHARWVNHPAAEADAGVKPRQLTAAAAAGFRVPETLVTTSPRQVRDFAKRHPHIVIKPLGANVLHEGGVRKVAHTHLLSSRELADLSGLSITTHLLQQWVECKDHEVRLTAVGTSLFAASILAGSPDSVIDWRADYDSLTYRVIEVPASIAAAVDRYLQHFRLSFAAFDFAVDTDGTWWFLEANPGGQYGWIEQHTGLPISETIAELLACQEGS
jgi:ATP-grasp ribosomal peptide maturase